MTARLSLVAVGCGSSHKATTDAWSTTATSGSTSEVVTPPYIVAEGYRTLAGAKLLGKTKFELLCAEAAETRCYIGVLSGGQTPFR